MPEHLILAFIWTASRCPLTRGRQPYSIRKVGHGVSWRDSWNTFLNQQIISSFETTNNPTLTSSDATCMSLWRGTNLRGQGWGFIICVSENFHRSTVIITKKNNIQDTVTLFSIQLKLKKEKTALDSYLLVHTDVSIMYSLWSIFCLLTKTINY